MTNLLDDLRFALRTLAKSPGFAAVAILTLALGIGANTAVFSVVNGVLLRPLPYGNADRLVTIGETARDGSPMTVSYFNFLDWRKQNRTSDAMAAYRYLSFNLTGSGDPERLNGLMASSGFFPVLGINPIHGRAFSSGEDRLGGNPVALIGEKFWRTRFGRDSGILGRTLTLNGIAYQVIGVMPSSFEFDGDPDVFLPLGQWDSSLMKDRTFHPGLHVVARRKTGESLEQVRADLARIASALAREYPKTNAGHGVSVVPLKDQMVGNVRPTLLVLLGAVAFVLLMACANVANLLLSRASARKKEIAVRIALGAGRLRIARQLLTESSVLALAGGVLGLALAAWSTQILVKVAAKGLPRMEGIGVDGRVLAFTLLASLITGFVFGLAPALELSGAALSGGLAESGRGSAPGRKRLRDLLVLGEIAVALALLTGGVLMIRTIWNLRAVNPGFDANNVLTLQVGLSPANLTSGESIHSAFDQLIDRIGHVPGVDAAAVSADFPLGADAEVPVWTPGIGNPTDLPQALWYAPSPGYLRAMRIPLLKGRFFDERDGRDGRSVAVIDEAMARLLFAGQDPIGRRVSIGGPDQPGIEIVGVVGHVKQWGLDTDDAARIRAQLYTPFAGIPDFLLKTFATGSTIVLRTRSNPLSIADAVRAQVIGADRDQPVYNVRTLDQIVTGTMAERRFTLLLLRSFAGIALLLASVGIYGVIAYSVSQRTREIGIRMALGARRQDVLKLVVGHCAMLALTGVGAGLVLASLVTRALSKLLFGVGARDPMTLAVVSALLILVALLASFLPARRAARVDPMVALRYE